MASALTLLKKMLPGPEDPAALDDFIRRMCLTGARHGIAAAEREAAVPALSFSEELELLDAEYPGQ